MLAADKLAQMCGSKGIVTKIFKHKADMIGICGTLSRALECVEWIKAGAHSKDIPEFQKGEDYESIMVIRDRKIFIYERGPLPFLIENEFYAIGSGSPYALAAMWCGRNAEAAVECASALNTGCGMGIDILRDLEATRQRAET